LPHFLLVTSKPRPNNPRSSIGDEA